MEHIFDDHTILQNIIVLGGKKASVSSPSEKYIISFEEAKSFFFINLKGLEYQKINDYLNPLTLSREEIITWCEDVIKKTLTNHRWLDLDGISRVSLRELFMERIALRGSAFAIIFLKKHYCSKKNKP